MISLYSPSVTYLQALGLRSGEFDLFGLTMATAFFFQTRNSDAFALFGARFPLKNDLGE